VLLLLEQQLLLELHLLALRHLRRLLVLLHRGLLRLLRLLRQKARLMRLLQILMQHFLLHLLQPCNFGLLRGKLGLCRPLRARSTTRRSHDLVHSARSVCRRRPRRPCVCADSFVPGVASRSATAPPGGTHTRARPDRP
jgi:hypothetical protein